MKNKGNYFEDQFLLSSIDINQLLIRFKNELASVFHNNNPSKIKEVLEFDDLPKIIPRTPQTIRKYIREQKIRSHYFDDQSPVFLRSEILEDLKNLPDYATIKMKKIDT